MTMIYRQSLRQLQHTQLPVAVSQIADVVRDSVGRGVMTYIREWRAKNPDYCEPDPYATEMPFVSVLWLR